MNCEHCGKPVFGKRNFCSAKCEDEDFVLFLKDRESYRIPYGDKDND